MKIEENVSNELTLISRDNIVNEANKSKLKMDTIVINEDCSY